MPGPALLTLSIMGGTDVSAPLFFLPVVVLRDPRLKGVEDLLFGRRQKLHHVQKVLLAEDRNFY